MNPKLSIVEAVLQARTLVELADGGEPETTYRSMIKRVHPDICRDPRAHDAFIRLTELLHQYRHGVTITDDAGELTIRGLDLIFHGDASLHKRSTNNRPKVDSTYERYLPEGSRLRRRAVPFAVLPRPVEQVHVNWILSRMLELICGFDMIDYVHGGFVPCALMVTPEDHGIQLVSFYHATRRGARPPSYSGQYRNWYPPRLFTEKRAHPRTDIMLAKRTAAWLLGDDSGNGVILRKTHNVPFVEFLLETDEEPGPTFLRYREMINANFEKKFYPFNV